MNHTQSEISLLQSDYSYLVNDFNALMKAIYDTKLYKTVRALLACRKAFKIPLIDTKGEILRYDVIKDGKVIQVESPLTIDNNHGSLIIQFAKLDHLKENVKRNSEILDLKDCFYVLETKGKEGEYDEDIWYVENESDLENEFDFESAFVATPNKTFH